MRREGTKKKTTIMLSLLLVAVLMIGGTLAYLSTTTDEIPNVFTFADNIKAKLDEPNWDPSDAENLIPGYEVKKDPMITNLSDNGVNEFVAMQVEFHDNNTDDGEILSDADALKLLQLLDIKWNTDDWSLKHGDLTVEEGVITAATANQVYVYKNVLSPGQVTTPLFHSVTIKEDISDEDYAWLAGIVMDHTDGCYSFGEHDAAKCDLTYKHHVDCAIYGEEAAKTTGKGEAIGTGETAITCDCKPAAEHTSKDETDLCPALSGTLDEGKCTHSPDPNSIKGFQIKVKGSAVQAEIDGMEAWDDTDTIINLIQLFGIATP